MQVEIFPEEWRKRISSQNEDSTNETQAGNEHVKIGEK